ncbi:MAG: hypothetical protein ABSA17_07305 [Rhabdochlamydiaceae bacterium]
MAIFGRLNLFASGKSVSVVESISTSLQTESQKNPLLSHFKRTIIDLFCVVSINGLTLRYAALSGTLRQHLLPGVYTVILNLFFRSVSGCQDYQSQKNYVSSSLCTALTSSVFYEATVGVLLHECGHAAAIKLLYAKPHIEIRWLSPFKGVTKYANKELSWIGNALGKQFSIALIHSAGTFFAVAASVSALVMGLWLRKSHPELSLYLRMISVVTVAHHVLYAYSALRTSRDCLTHDFVRLWSIGFHPHVAAISMIAVLGISALAYLAVEKRNSSNPTSEENS